MKPVVGVRHESIDLHERRAPLTPDHVRALVESHGVRVVVQPSRTRVFTEDEYRQAGAEISADLAPAGLVLGVKEVPLGEILGGKAYCFFSHTIKGQPQNMPLLRRFLELGGTLLDYELVKADSGRRLIAFGSFAGYAGMVNSLWAFGQRLRWEGIPSPFERVRRPHRYAGVKEIKRALRDVGQAIKGAGIPPAIVPVVCGVTGQGRVARGALSMLNLLPTERISPADLPGFFAAGQFSDRVIYRVHFYQADVYEPRDPQVAFDRYRLFRYPERFKSRIERVLSHLSILVNGIYWEPRFPRLVTKSALRALYEANPSPRLRVIGDITCDVDGSVEATVRPSTVDEPTFVFDPFTGGASDGLEGVGPVIMAVDKLPTELPREASKSFGDALLPFLPQLASADYSRDVDKLGLPAEFQRAVIAHRGGLAPDWAWLAGSLG